MNSPQIAFNEPLYDDYIAPNTIKFGMLHINTNLAKSKRTYECSTVAT